MGAQYLSQAPQGFQNHIENVAIVGAGGEQGSVIAEALIAQGKHKVTAITRPDSSSKLPEGLHAIKKANYDDHDALVAALKGQDFLVITLAVMAPRDSQTKIIDAAVAAGVRYIMPNEWGADYSNPALKETMTGAGANAIRQYIEKVGGDKTYWVALSCSFWYQFSLAGGEPRYGFDFANKTVTFFDDGKTKICTTTWPQTGRAVAQLLTLPILPTSPEDKQPTLGQWNNKAVYVTSFVISQRDMLDSILRVTNDSEANWTITHENSQERFKRGNDLVKAGNFMQGFATMLYSRVFFQSGEGDYSPKLDNEVLELPKEDLDEATKVAVKYAEDGVIADRDRQSVEAAKAMTSKS